MPNNAEYARILNVSDAVGHCTNYWEVIETDMYSKHCQTFKIQHFAKIIMPECRAQPEFFRAEGWVFVELGHFDKHFVKNAQKVEPVGKHFGIFSAKYS